MPLGGCRMGGELQKLKFNIMEEKQQIYVTMGWDGMPITTKGDGYILPRKAEMIINKKYYPKGELMEWPVDPDTSEKLPIEPMKIKPTFFHKISKFFKK